MKPMSPGALHSRNGLEVSGQVMRIALVPVGLLFGRLLPIPPELERLLNNQEK